MIAATAAANDLPLYTTNPDEFKGMTEADVLALAMSGPAGDFSIPDEVYVGGRRCPGRSCPG